MDQLPQEQIECLEKAVHSETRGVHGGPETVVAVILNRTNHPDFPETPCAVIYQKGQFTGIRNVKAPNSASKAAVERALSNRETLNKEVLYFHNTSVMPKWAHKLKRIVKIGAHIFYGEKKHR